MGEGKKNSYMIFVMFATLIGIRFFISFSYKTPHIFFDESVYYRLAYNFIRKFNFNIDTLFIHSYPPGYAIAISPATLARYTETSYRIVLLINCILNSLVFLFGYMLLEHIDSEEEHRKENMFFALLVSFIPSVFPYTFVMMSENLYIPLFIAFLILLYKSFERFENGEDGSKRDISTGLVLGYLMITRAQTIVPIIALVIVYIYIAIHTNEYKRIFKMICLNALGFLLVVIYPFISGRISQTNTINDYGKSDYINRFLSLFSSFSAFMTFIKLLLSEISYVFATTYGVFFILVVARTIKALKKKDDFKAYDLLIVFFMLTLIGSIILTVTHMFPDHINGVLGYDMFGRYLDPYIAPMLIFGFIEYRHRKDYKEKSLYYIAFIFSIIFTIHFVHEGYKFPNMYGVFYVEKLKNYISIKVFLFVMVLFAMIATLGNIKTKSIISGLMVFAIISSYVPISVQVSWGSRVYPTDNIGNWLNKQGIVEGKIYMDEEDAKVGEPKGSGHFFSYLPVYYLYTFWSPGIRFAMLPYEQTDDIIGKGEYFITTKVMPYDVLYSDKYFKLYDMDNKISLKSSDITKHIDTTKLEDKYLKGFYENEGDGRWIATYAQILLKYYDLGKKDIKLIIECSGIRPEGDEANVEVFINGHKVGVFTKGSGEYTAEICIDKKYLENETAQILEFRVNTWNPAETGFSIDSRNLGIKIKSIDIEEIH